MTKVDFFRQLEEVLVGVPGSLSESDSRDTVETWSSLVDVQIASLVQETLRLKPDAELLEAETVGDLLEAIAAKGGFED